MALNGPCTHTIGTFQSVLTGLHHLSLPTIHCLGGLKLRKGKIASADASADVACLHRYVGPPHTMRLLSMLLLEACWELGRTLVFLSSLVCLLLKPWSRCAPFLHSRTLLYLLCKSCFDCCLQCYRVWQLRSRRCSSPRCCLDLRPVLCMTCIFTPSAQIAVALYLCICLPHLAAFGSFEAGSWSGSCCIAATGVLLPRVLLHHSVCSAHLASCQV